MHGIHCHSHIAASWNAFTKLGHARTAASCLRVTCYVHLQAYNSCGQDPFQMVTCRTGHSRSIVVASLYPEKDRIYFSVIFSSWHRFTETFLSFFPRGIRIQTLLVSCTSICLCPLRYWIPGLCLQVMAASWSWGPSFFTARVTCSTLLSGKECLQVSAGALHDNNGNVTEDWQR